MWCYSGLNGSCPTFTIFTVQERIEFTEGRGDGLLSTALTVQEEKGESWEAWRVREREPGRRGKRSLCAGHVSEVSTLVHVFSSSDWVRGRWSRTKLCQQFLLQSISTSLQQKSSQLHVPHTHFPFAYIPICMDATYMSCKYIIF